MKGILKKLTVFLMALLLCFSQREVLSVFAETEAGTASETRQDEAGDTGESTAESAADSTVSWPSLTADIQAGSAIVMDADTGQVLWGKEMHTKRYPASVTKLLTALVVLENCSLDETVTFSSTAVSNLESGAVTIGAVAGDQLPVRDCLYALLLKSANEVANALAEHVAGSQEAFAVMMNRKAEELGCVDSDFRNPSGLTDSEHVTSAYDMALIGRACMNNADFLALESEPTRKLAATEKNPDGLTVTIGHKMRRKGEEYYDPRVIAGKTGYTSSSGNTLVTMAEDGGRRVVVVVLKDKNPAHYTDTQSLLDFGLEKFDTLRPDAQTLLEEKQIEKQLVQLGVIDPADETTGAANCLSFSSQPKVTVPLGAALKDVEITYDTAPDRDAPENAVAKAALSFGDSTGPSFYILNDPIESESENSEILIEGQDGSADGDGSAEEGSSGTGLLIWILVILLITLLGFAGYLYLRKRAAEKRRQDRRRTRRERMERLENLQRESAGSHRRSSRQQNVNRTAGRRTSTVPPDRTKPSAARQNGESSDPGMADTEEL